MAGIGFQLKKIVNKNDSFMHKIKAYTYSLFVVYGSMIISILCIGLMQIFMKIFKLQGFEINEFSKTVGDIFVFSNIFTGAIALVLTRYISDAIYLKEYHKIMPSLIGGFILGVIPGTLIYWCVSLYLGNELVYAILTGVFYALVSMIWILIIYIGALNNYSKILVAFIIGGISIFIAIIFTGFIPTEYRFYYYFLCLCLGFTIMGSLLFSQIRDYFGNGKDSIWSFMKYTKKYVSLIFINLFYVLGIYYENFYNFYLNPQILSENYLQPLFLASFVILPGMIYFVVHFETNYFEKHRIFLETINQKGTYEDISLSKDNLLKTFTFEYNFFVRVVVIFTLIIVLIVIKYLLWSGVEIQTLYRFISISIGLCFTVFMYILKIMFLYFDRREFALWLSSIFLSCNIISVYVLEYIDYAHLGLGLLISGIVSFVAGYLFFKNFIKNIEYYLFKIFQ